jgi:glycosyltransferase involved in cell wall biosynthesis
VLAASPEVAEEFTGSRCTVVRNYPEDLPVTRNAPEYSRRAHRVGYIGTLTAARGVEQMVDAMACGLLPPDWRFLLVGPHAPADYLDHLRKRPGWALVDHHGEVSPPEARRMIADCRIGIAVLQPVGQYADVLPTKLFEYMSLGLPVVSADYPNCRRVVESAKCGLLVDPTDPRAIAEAAAELAAHPDVAEEMGARGRAAVRQRFNWASEEKLLFDAYAALLDARGERQPA